MIRRFSGISSFTALILVFFSLTVTAQTVYLEPDVDGIAAPGEEGFVVPYYMDTQGTSVFGLQVEIGFDPAVLSNLSVLPGAAAAGGSLDSNVSTGSVTVGYVNAVGLEADGMTPLFLLLFDVANVASPAVAEIECLALQVFDAGGFPVDSACGDLSLSIISSCENPGDIAPRGNPDGVINVGDAVVALRAAVSLIELTEEEAACGDVAPGDIVEVEDGPDLYCSEPDGLVNVGDAVVLLRAAVGELVFDCEEGPAAESAAVEAMKAGPPGWRSFAGS